MERYECWYDIDDLEDAEQLEHAGRLFDKRVYALEQDQAARINYLNKIASVYQNKDAIRPYGPGGDMPQMILNLSQAICDGVIAKQVVNESKATFDVSDGDWEAKLKADELDRFVMGEMYRTKALEEHEAALKDAVAWAGDGWVKYTARDSKVYTARTNPLEMRIDPRACVSGQPRDLYQVRYITKELACALYHDQADEIYELKTEDPPYEYPYSWSSQESSKLVRLVEGWHLPETDKGDDGRYMFAAGSVVLECKRWKRNRFPFVRISYSKDVMGGYSISLGQQLYPLHLELNKIKRAKIIGLSIWGLPRIYQQRGSTISPELGVEAGLIYKYTGSKPETDQSPCYSAELAQEEQNISNQMYQIGGISPLERGADMPSRMDSRPGMREYVAATDEKHAAISLAWNRSFLDAAQQCIDVAREIPNYEAFGRAKDFISRIKFSECDLEDWRFQIRLANGNFLPTTPAGKRMIFLDLMKTPAFAQDPTMLLEMMAGDHPDVDALLDKKTAGKRLIERQLYSMTHKKVYMAPDVHQANDIEMAMQMCNDMQKTVLIQSNGGVDMYSGETIKDVNKVMALLDKYMTALGDIQADAQFQQQQQAAAQNQALQAQQQQAQLAQQTQQPQPIPTQGAINAGTSQPIPGPPTGQPAQ